jgi:chorismate synthase
MLRFLTAGESHGACLVAILEGMPAGVSIDPQALQREMRRRQLGYGRGPRMQFETDTVELLSGIRRGRTLGSPISLLIKNKDASIDRLPVVTQPRPGHADLTGAIKYDHRDIRNVLERASARETTARVAVGALCKQLLFPLGIALNGTSSVLYATVADLVTTDRRSRAYGLYYTLAIGASALAPAAYGVLGDAVGPTTTLVVISLAVLVTIPLCLALRASVADPARA